MTEAAAKPTEDAEAELTAAWARVLPLPCQLTVSLPAPGCRVVDVLALEPQSIVNTGWRVAADVPIRVNGELIAWGEFEVVENRLVVRLTELV